MKLTSALLLVSILSMAQTKPKPALSDLEFMAGNWTTTTEWGYMDETWSKPLGNSMMCSYRCVKDGKVVFYEFVLVEQLAGDSIPVMKLRHFNPGSIGWEDKESPYLYPLISLEKKKAVFQKPDKKTTLSYERISDDQLKAVLIQVKKDGKRETTEFLFMAMK